MKVTALSSAAPHGSSMEIISDPFHKTNPL